MMGIKLQQLQGVSATLRPHAKRYIAVVDNFCSTTIYNPYNRFFYLEKMENYFLHFLAIDNLLTIIAENEAS